jgi:hypothetical protein
MDDLSPIQKAAIKVSKSFKVPKIHTPFEDMPNIEETFKTVHASYYPEISELDTPKVAGTYEITPLDELLRIDELLNVLKEQARVLNAQNEAFKGYVEDARKETWFSRIVSIVSVVIALASLVVAVFK